MLVMASLKKTLQLRGEVSTQAGQSTSPLTALDYLSKRIIQPIIFSEACAGLYAHNIEK